MSNIFEKIIEPGLQTVPVLDLIHAEWHDGVKFRVTQSISRIVYTDFDRKLSDYFAATQGKGFPGFKAITTVVKLTAKEAPAQTAPDYHDSASHALASAIDRAVARVGDVEFVLQRADCPQGQVPPIGQRRQVDAAYVDHMKRGLAICNHMGATAFIQVSGEFGMITIAPPGGLEPVVLDLEKGRVFVPSVRAGASDAPSEWPIAAFKERALDNAGAQNYLAAVRHAIVTAKEAAILDFHSAAAERIHSFDRALSGEPLTGHWRESAVGFIARIQSALGGQLNGLPEDARGIALDWCAQLAEAGARGPRSVETHPMRAAG